MTQGGALSPCPALLLPCTALRSNQNKRPVIGGVYKVELQRCEHWCPHCPPGVCYTHTQVRHTISAWGLVCCKCLFCFSKVLIPQIKIIMDYIHTPLLCHCSLNLLIAGAAHIRVFFFYQQIKYHLLNMLKIKCDINEQYLKTVDLHFVNLNNFHLLDVVDRVSETQLQVGANSDWIIWQLKGRALHYHLYSFKWMRSDPVITYIWIVYYCIHPCTLWFNFSQYCVLKKRFESHLMWRRTQILL